ncbi:uncharacterized protein [Rutidosis leptorrhynchoides]|uniref:uncharacterized protein n=1 Tax=Rutidosis leptorrhynchoides TaxID=125765 RepID=UPI003A98D67C
MEEKNYDRASLSSQRLELEQHLNSKQKEVCNLIIAASDSKQAELIFVYGHGGTGKTFLWKAIITALRAEGKIVLAVTSSGIASLLLPSDRTAHSRFKLPFDLTDESVCNVKKNTQLEKLFQDTDLIVWDEAPMNDRRCFEALDRSLRDILNNNDKPFGGKSFIIGGDFKQTLPAGVPDGDDPRDARWIHIPEKFSIPDDEDGLSKLISFIYPVESLQNPTASELQQKAIVCPKNDVADSINNIIVEMVSGPVTTYSSYDTATPHGNGGGESEMLNPAEYLNTLNYPGLPPHSLSVKAGVPAILLRNINVTGGLCNGTRMIIAQLLSKLIEVEIITGTRVGQKVFLLRMSLNHNEPTLPFTLKRP